MIKLDISIALFLYLLFSVIGIFLLWIFSEVKPKRSDFKKDEDYVWRCSICANIYIDSISENVSRCPQCGSYVEINRPSQNSLFVKSNIKMQNDNAKCKI